MNIEKLFFNKNSAFPVLDRLHFLQNIMIHHGDKE